VLVRPRAVAGIQAANLIGTGAWPLLHRRSFERVSGRKKNFWLVGTVGGLAVSIGLSLGLAVIRGAKRHENTLLALASGVVFTAADVRAARTESTIYLADAALQFAFARAWLVPWD
jgi:hypothetical protein